jgi:hypothetical protein
VTVAADPAATRYLVDNEVLGMSDPARSAAPALADFDSGAYLKLRDE